MVLSSKNQLVYALKDKWPGLEIIHGRPRHPQSQGSVERVNAEVKKHLIMWQSDHAVTSRDWVCALEEVQFRINSSYHSTIKTSPIQVLYGKTSSIGLAPPAFPETDPSSSEDQTEEASSIDMSQAASQPVSPVVLNSLNVVNQDPAPMDVATGSSDMFHPSDTGSNVVPTVMYTKIWCST